MELLVELLPERLVAARKKGGAVSALGFHPTIAGQVQGQGWVHRQDAAEATSSRPDSWGAQDVAKDGLRSPEGESWPRNHLHEVSKEMEGNEILTVEDLSPRPGELSQREQGKPLRCHW